MRVLLTGASGFIGSHLIPVLHTAGHSVVCAGRGRSAHCEGFVEADFTRDTRSAQWIGKLSGVDAVINAVGILRERDSQTFDSVHVEAPCALFEACVKAGVARVIQISALGADEHASTRYHVSKRRADAYLSTLPLAWTIVQPSLVYGRGGQSARLFSTLASLPWIPVPARGEQRIQPVHIDDVTAGIAALLSGPWAKGRILPFVGPKAISLREFLVELRVSMGLSRGRFLPVPLGVMRLAARLGYLLPGTLLDADTLSMLLRGNVGDPSALRHLLGRDARTPTQFITADEAPALRTVAQTAWLLPVLRFSIALVWIVTGIVSLGLFPVEWSYQLLARVGVPGPLAPFFLYSAAALDLAFGLGTLFLPRRRALWIAQLALIAFYTVVITARMPEFWLHPYGPLLKNLPMMAAIWLLYRLEKR